MFNLLPIGKATNFEFYLLSENWKQYSQNSSTLFSILVYFNTATVWVEVGLPIFVTITNVYGENYFYIAQSTLVPWQCLDIVFLTNIILSFSWHILFTYDEHFRLDQNIALWASECINCAQEKVQKLYICIVFYICGLSIVNNSNNTLKHIIII